MRLHFYEVPDVTLKVQSSRILKLKRTIRRVLKEKYIKARSLARIAGQCVSQRGQSHLEN